MAQFQDGNKPMFSDTLFFEDWSSGSFATNQWQVDSSGLLVWRITNVTGNPAPSAIIDQSSILSASLSMTSKQIPGTNHYTELSYDIYFSDSSNVNAELAAELYDGNVWHSMDIIDLSGGSFPWTTRILNISDYCHNNFKIRFRFFSESFLSAQLNIDNIIVGSFPLGITEHQVADFIIKPNPAKSSFDLVLNNFENQKTQIIISDLTGKVKYVEEFIPGSKDYIKNLNINTLVKGIYLCEIKSNEKNLIRKVIIE
jgi:hypothetical protein